MSTTTPITALSNPTLADNYEDAVRDGNLGVAMRNIDELARRAQPGAVLQAVWLPQQLVSIKPENMPAWQPLIDRAELVNAHTL